MRFPTGQILCPLSMLWLLSANVPPAAAQGPPPLDPGGQVLWRFEIPSTVSGQHVGVGADGRIYTTSFSPPNLYALTPTGSLAWSLGLGGASGYWPISFAADGTIYTGAIGVRAVNADGTLRWAFDTGEWLLAGPSVGPDGNIYAADDGGLGFFSLDANGDLRWSNSGDPLATGQYTEADEIVFGDGSLFGGVHFLKSGPSISTYAFDLDGAQLWFRQIVGLDGGPSSNPRSLPDGRLVFRWAQGSMAALLQNGSDDWVESHPDGAQQLSTPAIGPDGAIYAGDQYGVQLWSTNPDGTTRWVRGVGPGEQLASVGLGVSPDNRVLIASGWTYVQSEGVNHGWIRGYDPADGDLLWQIDLGLEQGLTQLTRTVRPAFSPSGDTAYLTTWFVGSGVGHAYLYALALRGPTAVGNPAGDRGGPGVSLVSLSPTPCVGPVRFLLTTPVAGRTSVVIHDVAGREVRRLFDGAIAGDDLSLVWDLRDDRERAVDAGVYLVTARTADGTAKRRIVLVK